MVLVPTSSGIAAMFQFVVPLAVPDPPVEFVHVTLESPLLSRAVPFTAIELADVETVVSEGETILRLGADVPVPLDE
jgi:hypothetical protein